MPQQRRNLRGRAAAVPGRVPDRQPTLVVFAAGLRDEAFALFEQVKIPTKSPADSEIKSPGFPMRCRPGGAWRDNVFVERLWRTIKYEEVYLRAYDTVSDARASLGRYVAFYNSRRPHSSLDRQTPDRAYFNRLSHLAAA